MRITFRFASGSPPVPAGLDLGEGTLRLGESLEASRVRGIDSATLSEKTFNVLLVAAFADEVTVAELHDVCGFAGEHASTFTTLRRWFKGGALLEIEGSLRESAAARVRLARTVTCAFETVAQAREYVEDLFDRAGGTPPPMKPPIFVSPSLGGSDTLTFLSRFGYAPFVGPLDSVRGAFALLTGRSLEPAHLVELGAALGARVPVIMVGEPLPGGPDPVPLVQVAGGHVYASALSEIAIVQALQLALRPHAHRALCELTEIVGRALADRRTPEPVSKLRAHMRLAPSVGEAARQQQRSAHLTLTRGRGTRFAWRVVVRYADREYHPHLVRLERRASGDLANAEDLLRAFCLAH